MKWLSERDTTLRKGECWFEKTFLPDDSIVTKYKFSTDNFFTVFDGIHRFVINADSTALIIDSEKFPGWGTYMEGNAYSSLLYEYFFKKKKFNKKSLSDSAYSYSLISDEPVNSQPCFRILITESSDEDSSHYKKVLYVRKDDYVPVKFVEDVDWQDMHQFVDATIYDVKLNEDKIKIQYSIDSIPKYFNVKNYEQKPAKELLHPGNKMPEWKLISLSGETLESQKLNAKLVLIDFWYKNCGPCIKAMPSLQKLHEEFKDKGLLVLGINDRDKGDDALKKFLDYRHITYTILLADRSVSAKFSVEGFPSFYLVNKEGVIVYSDSGYGGEGTEKMLREKIEEQLKN